MAHIGINTAKAREIHKAHIREKRNPLLAAQDIEFQRAQETGASTVGIVSTKQALRDATDLANITINTVGVTSVTNQLKASWDTNLLGDNPW
tara:strand:- start:536 stop:811 length:276 start_codon:yes stop_codon:yes gene_type:complete